MSGSIREAEKARFVAKLGPMVRFREAEKARFVAQLGPVLRFSGCSAQRTAKCLWTVFRAWAWLGAGWAHGLPPGTCDHQPTFQKCEGSPANCSRSYAWRKPCAIRGIACRKPCAIIERVRSRGCSQIDKWLHHPLLHDQIVLDTSPIIFNGLSDH